MNLKTVFLAFIGLLISYNSFSQDIKIDIKTGNKSKKIKDGDARVTITGGDAPYKYKWSLNSVSIDSSFAEGITEGTNQTVTVFDSKGISKTIEFSIPAQSSDEKINSFFVPVVDAIGSVLMFDIFTAAGIYDPVLYTSDGKPALYPNGDKKTRNIPFVVVWLVLGAIYFTVKMKFVNFRGFKHSIDLIRGKYDNPNSKGEVTHFQALSAALSATVGLGNIAGVAIAITLGGPGATFWLIIAGLLGMASKFTEVTLGVKYRNIDSSGQVSGGPMYYLSKGFKNKNMGGLGKVLAVIYAILVIGGSFGGGNMFQANQSFSQFASQLSGVIPGIQGYGTFYGLILAVLVGVVVIGGIKSIAKVTEKIVPFMAILYVGTALIIIGMNYDKTFDAFSLIFNGAFSADAMKGGFIGVLIVGFQRASFSNEAGIGSASIAHSAVKTDKPVTEGIVALLEPFIDTVVICTMTALVIIFTGFYTPEVAAGLQGTELTSKAFESVFYWFPWILSLAVFLFAFSTMISWSYYGLNGFKYLFGRYLGERKIIKNLTLISFIYYILFLTFIVIGSASSLGAVVDFSDFMILSMAFPNILGLIVLAPEVKLEMTQYFKDLKEGIIKKTK